jgi:hypothetical protein
LFFNVIGSFLCFDFFFLFLLVTVVHSEGLFMTLTSMPDGSFESSSGLLLIRVFSSVNYGGLCGLNPFNSFIHSSNGCIAISCAECTTGSV